MSAREAFTKSGRLTKCPNQPHEISFMGFLGQWTWAGDAWSTLTESGFLHTDYLSIGYTEHTNGTWWFRLVIWKLLIHIAYLKESPNDTLR